MKTPSPSHCGSVVTEDADVGVLELDWGHLFQDEPLEKDSCHFKVAICDVAIWVVCGD
jgi:hypothetical protein